MTNEERANDTIGSWALHVDADITSPQSSSLHRYIIAALVAVRSEEREAAKVELEEKLRVTRLVHTQNLGAKCEVLEAKCNALQAELDDIFSPEISPDQAQVRFLMKQISVRKKALQKVGE